MSTVVTITNMKENTLEFDIGIEGLSASDMKVRFVVVSKEIAFSFDATKDSNDTWSVKVPALASLSRTAYNYRIEVIVDGYYFEPSTGILNVIGSHELYTTQPKNLTLTPKAEKVQPKKEEEEKVAVKAEEAKKAEETKEEIKKETKVEETTTEKPKNLLMSLSGITEGEVARPIPEAVKPVKELKKVVTTSVQFKKKNIILH